MGTNCLTSQLDFFIYFQKEYSPEFIFPNMLYVLNVVFQFIMIFYGSKFTSYKNPLLFSLALQGLLLIILPVLVIFVPKLIGFIISCLSVMFLGLGNALLLKSVFGIAPYLPKKYTIAVSIGQGFSGIIVNIIRYIVTFSIGQPSDEFNKKNEDIYMKVAFIFFGCGFVFIGINIILLFVYLLIMH